MTDQGHIAYAKLDDESVHYVEVPKRGTHVGHTLCLRTATPENTEVVQYVEVAVNVVGYPQHSLTTRLTCDVCRDEAAKRGLKVPVLG
jgi:hypothetical protein